MIMPSCIHRYFQWEGLHYKIINLYPISIYYNISKYFFNHIHFYIPIQYTYNILRVDGGRTFKTPPCVSTFYATGYTVLL